ncbi:MAG TPA: 5'/3'-nucleotidase SurE [Leptospiraceae bacterium]|nr:5'/3'-nucleotidase SurE [Spirochaetaceae bacterium]HBS05739.1 5'/3'-nucleotidase SurE [Leptospiraceae bacterium]
MRILICNDDGLHSNGMRNLEEVLSVNHEVWAVCPDRQRSGTSQAISLRETMRMEEVQPRHYRVSGFPVDCVNLALHSGMFPAFDLVVSGINHGYNLGDDVHYSGTVGAARHACIHGYRSVAISCGIYDIHADFIHVAEWFGAWLETNLHRLNAGSVYNINYPELPNPDLEVRFTRHGKRIYRDDYEMLEEEAGKSFVFKLKETIMGHKEGPLTDFSAIESGHVSITPLGLQTTNEEELQGWIESVKS